jgi:hypothetical protein
MGSLQTVPERGIGNETGGPSFRVAADLGECFQSWKNQPRRKIADG